MEISNAALWGIPFANRYKNFFVNAFGNSFGTSFSNFFGQVSFGSSFGIFLGISLWELVQQVIASEIHSTISLARRSETSSVTLLGIDLDNSFTNASKIRHSALSFKMPRHSLINGPLGAILVIPMEIPSEISSVTLL